jgi:EmrB/QacA subfamily drug resistance transporter
MPPMTLTRAFSFESLSEMDTPLEREPLRDLNDSSDRIQSMVTDLAWDCDTAFSPTTSRATSQYTTHDIVYSTFPQDNINANQTRETSMRRQKHKSNVENYSWPARHADYPQQTAMQDSAISLVHKKQSSANSLHENNSTPEDAWDSPTGHDLPQYTKIEEPVYPSPAKTALIMLSLYIAIFLVALDRTIMGPAVPAITNEFKSIGDIGWYGSAYMLTSCGFILLYGRIYTFFPTKPVFLSGIFLFEVGSAVCGAAQSSLMLIVGRAIAGFGSSSIYTGAILILLNTVPLHKRPLFQGLFGACFGVASVAGPLLGGTFTGSKLTWRWCFYINLPIGAVTIIIVTFLLKVDEKKPKLNGWKETVKNLDPLGTLLFLPSIICLLLALEWGAAEYPWSAPRMIALLTVFAALFVAFLLWQYFTRNTTATLPGRIVFQRSVAFGSISQFCVGATMITVSLFIPLWFQAIQGVSAMQSGIRTIPLVLSVVVGSILSGALVQRIGYYTPFMILGSVSMAVGAGLLTTWNINTTRAAWIGFQVVLGFGVGCTMQHPNFAVQIVLQKRDIPVGTAVLSLCQTLGGAVFASVGQNLYIDKFSSGLRQIGGFDPDKVLHAGATELTKHIPARLQPLVLAAYNHALTKGTFFAALVVACLAFPAALGMEWRSVKEHKTTPSGPATQDEEKANPSPRNTTSAFEKPRDSQPSNRESETLPTRPLPVWQRLEEKMNPDIRAELRASR